MTIDTGTGFAANQTVARKDAGRHNQADRTRAYYTAVDNRTN